MRVLLTGGTGFVGSHAAQALLAGGHELRLLVRDPVKLERVFSGRGLPIPEHVVGDIADEEPVARALEGCDAVVHAAALVAMAASRAREVLATNARGVENVVGGAHRRDIGHIVYVSSLTALWQPGVPALTADAPVVPGRSAYARSKADAERVVRALQDGGAPVHTLYPAAVVGPDDPGLSESNHALRTLVRTLVLLTSSGFTPVDVRDVAQLTVRLLERPGPGRWVAAAPTLSWAEVADTLDAVTGTRVRRLRLPGGLVRIAGVFGDLVKMVWDFDFPMTAEGMRFATQWSGADATRTERELGFRFRDPAESFADALRWMYAAGHVAAGPVGRLAREGEG